MLVNSKDILLKAREARRAVAAPDYIDMDSARVFVRVAQDLRSPIILSYAEVFKTFLPIEEAAAIGKVAADSVDVPIVLHLDHGENLDFVEKAIALGFTSVMLDASADTFDENVRKTKEAVKMASKKNVSVEAEIGHVGQGENYKSASDSDSIYTTVEEAVAFAEATKVDSLAVSIGTAHGVYKNAVKPVLNFNRLHELYEKLSVPMVLHGGSGTGDDNLYRCATEGIAKINVYTDFLVGAMHSINELRPDSYLSLKQAADVGMRDVLTHYMKLFMK